MKVPCSKKMKISLAKVLIMLLFYIDFTFSENIEVIRDFLEGNKNNWDRSKDSFNIPQSLCVNDSRYMNYCADSSVCNTEGTNDGSHFPCKCPNSNATLTYHNNQWRCLENKQVRKQQGCKINNLLFDENESDELRMLIITPKRRTILARNDCAINISSSWYIGCNGKKMPLKADPQTFRLKWDNNPSPPACFLKVRNVGPIDLFRGRVINLGIKWATSPNKEGCLLFKVKGNIKCAVDKPPVRGFSSSIVPTTFSSFTIATTSPNFEPSLPPVLGFSSSIVPASSSSFIMATASSHFEPSTAIFHPGSGNKQNQDDVSSSSLLGVIIGVTVSLVTVLLLIAALYFYRRQKTRKDAHRSTAGPIKEITMDGIPHTNVAFQLETDNDYVTSSSREPRTSHSGDLYASLNVQEGHNIYGHENTDEPFYNVVQEPSLDNEDDGQRYGSLCLHPPVYHALDDPEYPGNAENKDATKTDPVYNVLEEPFAESSNTAEHYGHIPVNEPFYNTLEQSQSNDGPQRTSDEPVYNTLEDPYYNGAGYDENYGSRGLQDPVYNVLEGTGNDEMEAHISDNKNIPVYAVVNGNKK